MGPLMVPAAVRACAGDEACCFAHQNDEAFRSGISQRRRAPPPGAIELL